ncbi:hypothetical protein BN1723_020258 [Verticillium longisporum]|uniref:Uncharacterized protein n=1 Tax=Verticillium longisporum TaxID=100787 RepID=A0A0G4NLN1_VERLO|nr:hypothetical protein BN1723_020258 [Verticillium longisporum]
MGASCSCRTRPATRASGGRFCEASSAGHLSGRSCVSQPTTWKRTRPKMASAPQRKMCWDLTVPTSTLPKRILSCV